MSWMQTGLPDLAQVTALLLTLLEKANTETDKRAKRSIISIPLISLGWCETTDTAYEDIQQVLDKQIFLAYRNTELHICIFTDANDLFWASIVTQCNAFKLIKPVSDPKHQTIAFLSSTFNNTELGWTIFEKEWFAILKTSLRLDYVHFCEPLIRVIIDLIILLVIFFPNFLIFLLECTKWWRFIAGQFIFLSSTTKSNTTKEMLMSCPKLWLVCFVDNEKKGSCETHQSYTWELQHHTVH